MGKALLDIPTRTFNFGVRIIHFCRRLARVPEVGRTLSGQLLRAGTSIGSMVGEGQAAQSAADFISKYAIALKEAREANYRLRLLVAACVLRDPDLLPLQREAHEITCVLGASIVTAKKNSADARKPSRVRR